MFRTLSQIHAIRIMSSFSWIMNKLIYSKSIGLLTPLGAITYIPVRGNLNGCWKFGEWLWIWIFLDFATEETTSNERSTLHLINWDKDWFSIAEWHVPFGSIYHTKLSLLLAKNLTSKIHLYTTTVSENLITRFSKWKLIVLWKCSSFALKRRFRMVNTKKRTVITSA